MATSANAPGGLLPMFSAPLPAAPPPPGIGGVASAASILSAAMGAQATAAAAAPPRLDNIAALAASAVFGHGQSAAAPPLPQGALPPLPTAPPPPPPPSQPPAPTSVVAIHNMATAADLADPDLEGDILGEAAKCGAVRSLKFVRHPADPNRVTVFLAFVSPDQAAQAASRLNQRYFGGQITATALYPQDVFDAGDYFSAL
jgi:hypothetical protein